MTKPAKTDPNGPKPTVAQAKAAWEAHKKPTLNLVLKALQDAGFTGTVRSTLDRWKNSGWIEKRRRGGPEPATPEDVATIKGVTQKVADEETAVETKAIDAAAAEVKALRDLAGPPTSLEDVKRIDVLIAEILLARRIQERPDYLVKFVAKDVGKLIESLKSPTALTVVMPSTAEKPADPRTVGGTLIEHDASERPVTPLQKAIDEFRSQKLKVVR